MFPKLPKVQKKVTGNSKESGERENKFEPLHMDSKGFKWIWINPNGFKGIHMDSNDNDYDDNFGRVINVSSDNQKMLMMTITMITMTVILTMMMIII